MPDLTNGDRPAKRPRFTNGLAASKSLSSSFLSDHLQHSNLVIQHWNTLKAIIEVGREVEVDGDQLCLAHSVAVARYSAAAKLDGATQSKVQASRELVQPAVSQGAIIYGVSTGFGGSADTRTKQTEELQRILIRELHYGILTDGGNSEPSDRSSSKHAFSNFDVDYAGEQACTHLPRSWTRASILIRMNSLAKGHSGVRAIILDRMSDLLNHDIVPMIPMRGSISASGDLSPLSYIGGAIQGKSTIRILGGDGKRTARTAFKEANIEPVILQSKEGLAIVNGTAISAGSACLGLHDAHGLLVLSQILTAMSVEAFEGTEESFDPFFSKCRPHPGQTDAAASINAMLKGSHFVKHNDGAGSSLRQDRYSIRTAPQWLGPTLEDFCLAHEQMTTELNSTTDNPIISSDGRFLHGGNFQAKSVTSAMEKIRQGIQNIGRMLFSQCTELINPATSRGLPPNLVIEDPNSSFIFKGTDLNIAALQSELGLLSAPCNHVMTAEMGNQSLNSLALISARYTHTAIDVLSQMLAIHLLALCQALDIRALYAEYFSTLKLEFETIMQREWVQKGGEESVFASIWAEFREQFASTVNLNTDVRFEAIGRQLRSKLWHPDSTKTVNVSHETIEAVTTVLTESAEACWRSTRSAYLDHGSASQYLGQGSRKLYDFVRYTLNIPLLCTDRLRTPPARDGTDHQSDEREIDVTVGTYSTSLYRAIKDGRLMFTAVDALEHVKATCITSD